MLVTLVAAMSLAMPRPAGAANVTWNDAGGGNLWSQGGNWTGGNLPTTSDDVFFGSSFNSSTIDLDVNGSTRSFSIYTNNTWTISTSNTSSLLINSGSFTRTSAVSGTQTIATGVTLGANAVWAINGSGGLVISGGITDGASTFSLTKSGTGLLVLSGSNTYGGTTTISGGTLRIGNGSTTGSIGAAAVTNNAALAFNRSNDFTFSNNISGTGDVLQVGSGTTTLSGSNSYTGGTTLSAGGLTVGSANALGNAADLTVDAGTLNLNGYSVTVGTLSGAGGSITSGSAASIVLSSNSATSGTYSGIISNGSGTTGFTQLGTGTTTFTGANTYTGATTISVGALQIGSGSTTGDLSTGAVVDNSRLIFNRSNALTFDNVISGTGAVLQMGSGTTSLTGANTYTGITTISAGALQIGNASTTGSIGAGAVIDNSRLIFNRSNALTFDNAISGTGAVLQVGSGTTTLSVANTYTGTTTISAGALNLQNNSALGSAAAGTTVAAGAALQLQNGITVTGEAITLTGSGISNDGALRNISGNNTYAGTVTLGSASRINSDAGLLTLNTGTITGATFGLSVGGAGNTTISSIIGTTNGGLTKDGAGTLTLSAANTYTGLTSVSGGTLAYGISNAISSGGITLTSGATLDLGSYNDTLGTVTLTSGNIVGSGTLTSNANFATTSGTISAVLGGSIGVAQAGGGTTVLSGANTFTGATTIANTGVLNIQNATALGTTAGGVTVSSGGALEIQGGITVGAEALSLSGSGISNAGALRNVSGNNTYSGTVTLGTASRINSDAGLLTLNTGTITGSGFGLSVGGAGDTTIASIIGTTTGGLTKDGGGTLTLSAANTYTGVTTISSGILRVATLTNGGAASGIGQSTNAAANLVINGGSLQYAGVSGTTDRQFTAGTSGATLDASGLGAFTFSNTSAITLSGSNTSRTLTLTGSNTGNNTLAAVIGNNGTGATSLVKSGAGTWVLTGSNGYTGGTTINAGTLITGNAAALGTGTATINGGVLNLNSLSTVTNIFLVKGGTLTNGTILSTQLSGSSSGVIAVTLSGTGGLTKTTTDTVALNGSNTYSGTSTIGAGTMQIDTVTTGSTAQSLGTGNTVNLGSSGTSSGILQFTGTGGALSKNIYSLGNGSDTIENAGSGRLSLSGTLTKNGTILRLWGGSRGINVTGRIVGSSANSDLAIQYGTTTLSATNSYVGPTYINSSGTLVLNIDNAIPSNSIVTIGGTFAGGDGGAGTLSTGTFVNAIGGLLFSGSGGTISLTPTSRQTSTVQLSSTGSINLNGGPTTLDLTGMAASAGLYKLISGSSLTGTFGTVTGLDSNYLLRYGTVNANELDAQRKADQATTFTMTTGGVTRALVGTTVGVSGTITNSTPTGGSDLAVSLSSGGLLSVTNLVSGTNSVAPQFSTSVSGSIGAGSTAGTQTWSVINTDNNAITTTSTASGSLQVVDQRVFNVTTGTIALGRYLIASTPTTGTTGVTSTGLYSTTASGSLGSFSSSNGLTLTLNSGSSNFAGATLNQTAGYLLGGTAASSGVLSGSFSSSVTAEFGSINPVVVNYTGNAVDQRVFTSSTSTLALGYVHQGATVSGPTVGVSSNGLYATTASGTLGSFTGGAADFSLGLASGSAQFVGATASQTATYSIAGTASTLGSVSGTYSSAVSAEFGSISNVTVAVTGLVYSGQSTWNTNSGGNWGTITGTGQNAFGLNWGDNQGSPGLDPSYTNTDTATFGSTLTSGTAVVNTNGANISLKSITFDNANGHYAIYQTNGSSSISLVGSGTSASEINVVAGNHAIHADVTMGSSLAVNIGAGSSLIFHNAVSGGSAFSLTKSGAGTLFFAGNSSYSGNTNITEGFVSLLAGVTPLGSGTVTIFSSGTLDLNNLSIGNTIDVRAGGTLLNSGTGVTVNVDNLVIFDGITNGTVHVNSGGYADFQAFVNQAVVTVYSGGTAGFQSTVTDLATISVLSGGQAVVSGTADGSFSVSGLATFNGSLGGDLTVNSGGVVAFNGNNDSRSSFNVATGGRVNVGTSGTIGGQMHVSGSAAIAGTVTTNADVIVQSGGTVQLLNNAVFQQGNLTNNGSLLVDRTTNLTLNTLISGTGGVIQNGSGTLFLNAANTYTGNTVVNSGTLSGTGSVLGHVAVHNGGTLTAGSESAAYGVFTADSLSLDTGATASLSIGGTSAVTYDQIVTAGAIDFGNGNLTINFDNGGFGNSDVWQLFSGLSFTGNFAHVTAVGSYGALTFNWQGDGSGEWKATGGSLAAGQSMSFYVNNSSAFAGKFTAGQLVIVPEPSTMVFAGIGLTVLGWRQWRRRRSRVLGS